MGEKRMKSSHSGSGCGAPQLEDVPELMQNIQSRLPVKEATCTSVLSKSWLHAWSTIPTLRFFHRPTVQQKHIKLVDINHTLIRYIRDNIPIESFDLVIDIQNQESASLAENWFRLVATKTCVKELSLTILLYGASFNMPYEILSSENLTKITIISSWGIHSCLMTTTHNHVTINCVSLRELVLDGVHISQQILNGILLSCSLLEKIELFFCSQYLINTNINYLYELRIYPDDEDSTGVEISDLLNIRLFGCDIYFWRFGVATRPFKAHSLISLGSSVTQLSLGCHLIKDVSSLDMMIESEFPLLERLSLGMTYWMLGSFHFRCATIKGLSLLFCPNSLINVQVHAPKLVFFQFDGDRLPSLLFPISTLKKIILRLNVDIPVDASLFLMMWEALALSHKCNLHIKATKLPLDINIDNLRERLSFPPARNVQQLSFQTYGDECMWERSPFF